MAKNDNKEKAYQMYKESNGKIELVEIAAKLEIPVGTIRSWKSRDKWDFDNATLQTKKENKRNVAKVKEKKVAKKLEYEDIEGLTEKQKLFAEIYVKNFNATQAAIKAGYSIETAYHMGYENLNKPHIREYIEWLKELKKQSLMVGVEDIVERYMKIAFADMTDFMEFGTIEAPTEDILGNPIIDDSGNIIITKKNYLNFKDSTITDGGLICEISVGKNGSKIKLEDRQKALDWLSRYFGMNPMDKHKIQFDNAKLELEKLKAQKDIEEIEIEDDGFMDAIKSSNKDLWDDD